MSTTRVHRFRKYVNRSIEGEVRMSFYPHKGEVEMELYPPRAVERTMKMQEIIHTFREGDGHAGGRNGRLRVLVSGDGEGWKSATLLTEEGVDLRDPKLSVMAGGRLLLISGGCLYDGDRYLTRAPGWPFPCFP